MKRKSTTNRAQDGQVSLPSALFAGYDTFANAGRLSAVTGTQQGLAAGEEDASLFVCIGLEQVLEKIDFSASISSNFGFGGEDARAQFIESLNITETSVVVLIRSYKKATLKEGTAALKSNLPTDPRAFFKQYGDSYVTTLTQGSSYCAVWVFYATSVEEQTTITGTLKLNGITEDGYVNGSAQAKLNDVQKSISIQSTFDQQVFGFANLPLPALGDIVTWSQNFPQLVPDAPMTYEFEVAHYEDLGVPSFDAIAASRALFNGGGPENPGIAGNYQTVLDMSAAAESILGIYSTYGLQSGFDPTLINNKQDIDDDNQTLFDLIGALENDPTQTPPAPTLESIGYGMPSLNAPVTTLGLAQGNPPTGGPFQDVDAGSVVARANLSELDVCGVDHLHQIQSNFVVRDPKTGVPQQTFAYPHGYSDGTWNRLLLQPGELVNYVDITASYDDNQGRTIVQQLTVKTNKGNSMSSASGLPEPAPSDPYPWTAAPNQAFIGFWGRSGEEIDALGIVVANFSPATWTQPSSVRSRPRRRAA